MGNDLDSLGRLGTQINRTACPGPKPWFNFQTGDRHGNCAHFQAASATNSALRWGTPDMFSASLASMQNRSETYNIQHFRQDNKEIALLLPGATPSNIDKANISTFSLSSTCSPETACSRNETSGIITCPGFDPGYNIDLESLTNVALQRMLDLSDGNTPSSFGYKLNTTINPTGVMITLWYDSSSSQILYPPTNASGWYSARIGIGQTIRYYLASCVMTVYNTTVLLEKNKSPVMLESIQSDFNTTSALLAALDNSLNTRLGYYLNQRLESSLALDSDTFSSVLAGNMTAAALGLASPLLMTTPALSATISAQQTVNRYPLAPLCAMLSLHYLYGLGAVVLLLHAWIKSSRIRNTVREAAEKGGMGGGGTINLDQAHLNLRSALAIIADRFDDGRHNPASASRLSASGGVYDDDVEEDRLVLQSRGGLTSARRRGGVGVRKLCSDESLGTEG